MSENDRSGRAWTFGEFELFHAFVPAQQRLIPDIAHISDPDRTILRCEKGHELGRVLKDREVGYVVLWWRRDEWLLATVSEMTATGRRSGFFGQDVTKPGPDQPTFPPKFRPEKPWGAIIGKDTPSTLPAWCGKCRVSINLDVDDLVQARANGYKNLRLQRP